MRYQPNNGTGSKPAPSATARPAPKGPQPAKAPQAHSPVVGYVGHGPHPLPYPGGGPHPQAAPRGGSPVHPQGAPMSAAAGAQQFPPHNPMPDPGFSHPSNGPYIIPGSTDTAGSGILALLLAGLGRQANPDVF